MQVQVQSEQFKFNIWDKFIPIYISQKSGW